MEIDANSSIGRRHSAHITGCIMPSGWWVGLDVAIECYALISACIYIKSIIITPRACARGKAIGLSVVCRLSSARKSPNLDFYAP